MSKLASFASAADFVVKHNINMDDLLSIIHHAERLGHMELVLESHSIQELHDRADSRFNHLRTSFDANPEMYEGTTIVEHRWVLGYMAANSGIFYHLRQLGAL